ncbi:MAG: type II toxin-antitoxin system HipA family toxin [Candidatus Melainabacteria bacterium]|nr:type II toxin-antitoxin system HipA family toxin [Candidatus Melainabacteria bacterium]
MTNSTQTQPRILTVHLNEADVGTLTLLPDDRTLFAFSESYMTYAGRPILSQWFRTPLGELKTEEKIRSRATLPPFFSNLLPEGHLRDYLAKKVDVKPEREFFLIAALGQDLPGAVRVSAADTISDGQATQRIQSESDKRPVLRFSLAGVQMKFSAVMEPTDGLTIRADGAGGSWIVKLPSNTFSQVPEAEFSMLTLARRSGINVPEFKLVSTSSIKGLPPDINERMGDSLVLQRFDRRGDGTRIHMEDFAQVFGLYPSEKYENVSFDRIGFVILSECGEEDFVEFIRRLVFTVAIGNGDMHVKNWSLLYSDQRRPRLSPAYDFVPSILYLPGDDLGLRLGGCKAFRDVHERHFAKLASRAHASERVVLNTVRETLQRIADAWKETRNDLPLSKEMQTSLNVHMQSILARD